MRAGDSLLAENIATERSRTRLCRRTESAWIRPASKNKRFSCPVRRETPPPFRSLAARRIIWRLRSVQFTVEAPSARQLACSQSAGIIGEDAELIRGFLCKFLGQSHFFLLTNLVAHGSKPTKRQSCDTESTAAKNCADEFLRN
jgi:hypothetical protein